MPRKYIAFDIETAKHIAGAEFNWKPQRPLGISCIGSQSSISDEPRVWMTRSLNGTPAPQMSPADLTTFVQYLGDAMGDGFMPLSWNGLAFDFDILSEESGLIDECQTLALGHVDMMFHVVCVKGFPVSLANAAAGLRLPGKLAGVEGIDAPLLWAQGKYDAVTEYVAQDVRTTLAIAQKSEQRRAFEWTTRKGSISSMPLKQGWLTVKAALQLPLPDTSWMSAPPSRRDFTSWLDR